MLSPLVPREHEWTAYLMAVQLRAALLCALVTWLGWSMYPVRIISLVSVAWYLTQTVDEYLQGNLWSDGRWEDITLAVIAIIIIAHLYFHERYPKEPA